MTQHVFVATVAGQKVWSSVSQETAQRTAELLAKVATELARREGERPK